MTTIQQAMQLAVRHHRAGELRRAEQIYRQILDLNPQHADALHFLGVIAHQHGRNDVALDYIGRAIQLDGAQEIYHGNLAMVFRSLGKLDDAIRCYQRLLEINPKSGQAWHNLAVVEKHRGFNQPAAGGGPPADRQLALHSWIEQAYDIGMLQIREEIVPLCEFLADKNLNHVMEIGSHKGGTFLLWCHLARGKKISLDLPGGNFSGLNRSAVELRNSAMRQWAPNVFPLSTDSHDPQTARLVAEILAGDRLDFLMIDGDHTYQGVKADYEMYQDFVRPGGYIAFHDIVDSERHRQLNCFVAQLWNELCGEKIEFNSHEQWAGIGVLRTPTT